MLPGTFRYAIELFTALQEEYCIVSLHCMHYCIVPHNVQGILL